MTERGAARELAKWVAVTVAVLLTVYVGAYYKLVGVSKNVGWIGRDSFEALSDPYYSEVYATDERLTPFFAPIHRLDRRIRPQVWDTVIIPRIDERSGGAE